MPEIAFGAIGVGIGMGKIYMDQPLKPGGIYSLPSLPVLNTGTEGANYEVIVSHRDNQPEKKPKPEWVTFEPSSFYLEPGQVKNVSVKLVLPVKVEPGDYFAFLEAYPVIDSESGVTSVGIAAAGKLYFTVDPANMWQGFYYRSLFFYQNHKSIFGWALKIFIGTTVLLLLKKFVKLDIKIKK